MGPQDLGRTDQHNQAWRLNSQLPAVTYPGQSAARVCVYRGPRGLRNLIDLIDPSKGCVLQVAFDINESGPWTSTATAHPGPAAEVSSPVHRT